jgi:hypothetical protein
LFGALQKRLSILSVMVDEATLTNLLEWPLLVYPLNQAIHVHLRECCRRVSAHFEALGRYAGGEGAPRRVRERVSEALRFRSSNGDTSMNPCLLKYIVCSGGVASLGEANTGLL